MKSNNYVVIQGWMCNELELKGNELLVYALIHGFSQDGESVFSGSRKYIAETFNISLPTVDKALSGLVKKDYIEKISETINGITFNSYKTLHDVKKLYRGSKETLQGGSKETLHNNTNKQTTNNKKNNSKELLQNSDFQFGKQKSKKDNLYTKCVNLIDRYDFSTNNSIRNLLLEYLNYRISVKDKPLYTNMWKGMLDKLCNLCDDDILKYECIIKQSIERGYLSFYPIKDFDNLPKRPWEEGVRSSSYTDEELDELAELEREREKKGMRTKF